MKGYGSITIKILYVLCAIAVLALVGFVGFHQPRALLWYLVITLVGIATLPITYELFSPLPDRGYAFAKTTGLLLWGFSFWLFSVLGITNNNMGGILFAFLIVLSVSVWAYKKQKKGEIANWLGKQKTVLINVELLFLFAFFLWAFIRGYNPEILGTEKPMELAFINAILRSPRFPPLDPWLSGYAISYYHFGYILVGMLAKLTGTSAGIAFNLALALVFGLSAVGAYGLLYNLLTKKFSGEGNEQDRNAFAAWLAPFYVLIVSNLEGILHYFYNKGVFWRTNQSGELVSSFWTWLGIRNLDTPPKLPATPLVSKFWWWWQASRVVRDYDFKGIDKGDVINEFPMFSYILGDLHPHILAMPFAFLAIAFAMSLFFEKQESEMRWLGIRLKIRRSLFWFSALGIGALSFLNTWDFPFYVALFAGVYAFFNNERDGSDIMWKEMVKDFFVMGFALGVTGLLFYLPFFISFSSQAGGILPNLIYITRGVHFWVMFAPFLVPILGYLIYMWAKDKTSYRLEDGLQKTLLLTVFLFILMFLLVLAIALLPLLRGLNEKAAMASHLFLTSMAAPNWRAVIIEGFKRRIVHSGTFITLFVIFMFAFTLLVGKNRYHTRKETRVQKDANGFALVLILLGGLLVFTPEFVFLRDLFGYRINTIFKFYFQAWLMWGIAASFGTVVLVRSLKGTLAIAFKVGMLILLGATMVYPYFGLLSKTNGFHSQSGWTLDGTAYLKSSSPDEAEAMAWLKQAPLGVLAEAIGGSYTNYARMSTNSGQPTVLGWEFHEIQWRGSAEKLGSRHQDIERLYCSNQWEETEQIINQYNIRYIVVGDLEQSTYMPNGGSCSMGLQINKFEQHLIPVFRKDHIVIYLVNN